jgi:hypothetical protein
MSLEWYTSTEPEVVELEECCRACGKPMLQKGTSVFCSSRAPSCPTRVATSPRTTGDLFNEAGRLAGKVVEPAYNDWWAQLNATR